MRHCELSDEEWAIIAALLPADTRRIEGVDDRCVITKDRESPKRTESHLPVRSRVRSAPHQRLLAAQ
jgi:hypothetical protein